MKIKPYTLISVWGLIVSPILSLPFILYGIYKKDKYSLYLMAFFLGIVAFLTPPVSDLYRHTSDFYSYKSLSLKNFMESLNADFVAQTISYFLAQNGINFAFARFFYVLISLSIYFYIFNDLLLNKDLRWKEYFLLWVILFAGYNYFELVLGIRFGLATAFLFGSFYFLFFKKNLLYSLIFGLFSSFTHYFLFPITILMFIVYYIPFKINKKMFLILSVISIFLGFSLASSFIFTFYDQQAGYIDGQWGLEYTSNASLRGLIYYYLKRYWILPLFYFCLITDNTYFKMRNLIYVLAFFFMSISPVAVISGRIATIISIFLVFYYVLNYKIKSNKTLFNIILLSSLSFFMVNIFAYRFAYKNNPYLELYKPIIFILDNQIYSKDWLYSNINDDGYFK